MSLTFLTQLIIRLSLRLQTRQKRQILQVRPFDFGERDVSLIQTDLFDDLRKRVESFDPDLIAISILEPTFAQAVQLLDVLGEFDIPLIAGGGLPDFCSGESV